MNKKIAALPSLMHSLAWALTIFYLLFFITMFKPAYAQASSTPQGTQDTLNQTSTGEKGGKNKPEDKTGDNNKDKGAGGGSAKPAAASGNVQFADLVAPADQKPKLPYGQPFTISGNLADVCVIGKAQMDKTTKVISCGTGGQKITEIFAATTVGGKYIVSGQETPFTASQVSGDSWSVTAGKLDENTPVTFRFTFSGKLSQAQAAKIADQLLFSRDFTSALDQFLAAARGKSASEQAVFASALGQTTAQKVLDLLTALHVTSTNPDDFRKLLSSPTPSTFGLFVNLPAELDSLRQLPATDKNKLGFQDIMNPSAAYEAITAALKTNIIGADQTLKTAAQRFVGTYEALRNQLAINVAADLSVDVGTTADGVTEDLKKYAGFDVGALYAPRLNELRSFATVNIYFGSVSLHPSNGTRPIVWERLSLTFGMALKDVSGGDTSKSKIKGENAFAYGLGIRLNKYFRLTAGGLLYRTQLPAANGTASPITNKLRNELFIGPSIDLTAIPALKGIFAKTKSN